jgi:hypothetical protein
VGIIWLMCGRFRRVGVTNQARNSFDALSVVTRSENIVKAF